MKDYPAIIQGITRAHREFPEYITHTLYQEMRNAGFDPANVKHWKYFGVDHDKLLKGAWLRLLQYNAAKLYTADLPPEFIDYAIAENMWKADLDPGNEDHWRAIGINGFVERDYLRTVLEIKQRLRAEQKQPSGISGFEDMALAV